MCCAENRFVAPVGADTGKMPFRGHYVVFDEDN
jgi:hypothetical protein